MPGTPPPTPVVPSRIETPRLLLRPYVVEDGPALFRAVNDSLADLLPWLPWADRHATIEASTETCRRLGEAFAQRADFTMGTFRRDDGALLGGTGLHRVQWDLPCFEIGYWLRSSAVGRGYAAESTRALVRTCFEDLGARRVETRCDPLNARSTAVAERAGFVLEGTLRQAHLGVDGLPRDQRVYALVRQDWERGRGRGTVAT